MRINLLRFLSLLLFVVGCQSTIDNSIKTLVEVTGGTIEGLYDESGMLAFKGIPFAAPPVGELRWKAPQPVIPWKGVKECKNFGPSPIQQPPLPFMFWSSEFLIPEEPISEDCLHLNVWTKAKSTEEKRPVLVYIYGGGFQSGGSGCPIYDGTSMAKKGIVFVSINYRVGTFGFLAHPELSTESPYGSSGNYGILDMIAALTWVNENISSFGGDPDNVTIAGQSAGAFGVNYLAASSLASGLFHNAIAQSGGNFYQSAFRPTLDLVQAEELGLSVMNSLGSENLEELRRLPADSILNAPKNMAFPFVDDYLLEQSIYETYKQGKQNDVNLILGWNGDDIVAGPPPDMKTFKKNIKERFGDLANEFLSVYPAETNEEMTKSYFEMSRDGFFAIQLYTWAKIADQTGTKDVYLYNFNKNLPAHSPETQFGAFHSGEIVYAYDNLHTLNRPWEDTDHELAGLMSSYWVNFAKTGNPNNEELPTWFRYDDELEHVMILDTEIRSVPIPTKDKLNFWEKYYSTL